MNIDKSLYELINILLASKQYITISLLSSKIKRSRKIVYYNIEKLNILLLKNNESQIENKPKLGIFLTENQKIIIRTLVNENVYILSKEEREIAISLLIFTHPKKYTLDLMINIFEVSRNSILSNLKNINNNLKKFNKDLKIKPEIKGGYKVFGPELAQIQYLYIIIKDIMKSRNYKFINFIQKIYEKINVVFSDEFIEFLTSEIYALQIKLGKSLEAREIDNFIFSFPYLYMCVFKNNDNFIEKDLEVLKERLEYRLLSEMFSELEEKYELDNKEKTKLLFTLILLCTNKKTDIHNTSQDFIKQRNEAKNLVDNFLKKSENEFFIPKEEVIKEITTFLKVLTFKKKYNIISNDIDYLKIKKENKELFEIIKNITKKSEFNFSDYDISNILIYFKSHIKVKEKKVLLVSDETYPVKKMIENLIINSIKNIIIVDVINSSKTNEYEYKNIDFIICTDETIFFNKETIYIGTTMSYEDMLKIFLILNN